MTWRILKRGESIEIGDTIQIAHGHGGCLGTKYYLVHRVTPKFAFVAYNKKAEGKFLRVIDDIGPREIPRMVWDSNTYKALTRRP